MDCEHLMKPDFIFFGEHIPEPSGSLSFEEVKKADVCIIIDSTGEVIPASWMPHEAKKHSAYITIEIKIETTAFTSQVTGLYIATKVSGAFTEIDNRM
ncbi:MAG: Sir2 family NAD-dependent protein deacetylase [Bacteroidales bacterium]